MRTLLTTDAFQPRDSFRLWREAIHELVMPVELTQPEAAPFKGSLKLAQIGDLPIISTLGGAVRSEATLETVRQTNQPDSLMVTIVTAGGITGVQDGKTFDQKPGVIVLIEPRPVIQDIRDGSRTLVLQLPRERVERMLGSARFYAGLLIGGDLPSTILARSFIDNLIRVHDTLTPDVAARMASIATDLFVASVAERMAQEPPRSIQGNVVVQRAKAYIETNLGNPGLGPAEVAIAVGVSLRRLQQLFHERGRHISEWIWDRRLETAAHRLADPGQVHLPIGTLAYDCGFSNQAHFSRRFRSRYDVTPIDYRRQAMASRIGDNG